MLQTQISQRLRFSFGNVLEALGIVLLLLLVLHQSAIAEDAGVPQALEVQQVQMQQVQQQVVDLSDDIAFIRLKLIEERFQSLQQMAEANGWGGNCVPSIPPPGSLLRPSYDEWVFLKENLDAIRRGERPVIGPLPEAQNPPAPVWME